ncbi:hypothetical protein KDH_72650 [Dictyobacter sp. S3.2.2.5]|uniref:Uncharacterized protein n=2 Tax=Dictyobacter halimunensis TaxID=3026934 RepID=A0ABQ6G1P4_9CHLR|nr:hypothetical protein KDH_72650 [Dictyobacter sp. S3.2.2.5]
MLERCAAPAGEQGCRSEGTAKDSRKRLGSAKARERERVNALLAESRAASDAVLGIQAKATIHRIAREFNDMALHASCGQTTTLYRHLLRINEVEDQYTLTDPDLFLSEMMQTTYERLRDIQFRRTDCERRPNGMPLFFTDLRGQVVHQVEHIQQLRQQEAQAASTSPQAEQPREGQQNMPDWKPERPLRNADDPLSTADDHRLREYVYSLPLDDSRALVDHARRLKVVMSEEEVGQILAGTASDHLCDLIAQAVRQELYYEIKASWVAQPGYDLR